MFGRARLVAVAITLGLTSAWPFEGRAVPPEDEAQRVELVARLERSVAVVLSEGSRLLRDRGRIALVPWEAVGGGVILSRDGLVLTAAHVVAEGERAFVKVHGVEEPAPARIVFIDEPSDVALLRIEAVRVPSPPPGSATRASSGRARPSTPSAIPRASSTRSPPAS